jgi:outer membrane lipoprotein-sorting protein
MVSEVAMQIIRPGWQNQVKLKTWSKGYSLALILITAPAKDKGQTYLKRENDLWNWLPSIEKTVKLSSTLMSQSWMGSDFNNEDLINKASFLNDYHHQFLSMEEIRGKACYKIELLPKDDAPVVWGKVHLWISNDGYDKLKALFFDENNELVRTMNAFDVKNFGNKSTPSRIEMQPADKPKQKTVMIIENYEFNRPIENDFFSQQNMRRIR